MKLTNRVRKLERRILPPPVPNVQLTAQQRRLLEELLPRLKPEDFVPAR